MQIFFDEEIYEFENNEIITFIVDSKLRLSEFHNELIIKLENL